MGTSHGQDTETELLAGDAGSSDNYELTHIVSVASAYLDSGQVDDAEDLLQEAIDAGAAHPDVQALVRRLNHVRGRPDDASPANTDEMGHIPDVLVNFTAPLPRTDEQPTAIQKCIRSAELHYSEGRIFSALDLTQLACAEAPDFVPGFVRLAELQLLFGNVDQANDLYTTLLRWHDVEGETPGWLIQSLGISLNPGDTSALLGYAMSLIETGEVTALEPFVPEAIARTVSMNASAAMDLAEAYLKLRPDHIESQRLFLEVVTEAGDTQTLIDTTRRLVNRKSPLDLLTYRMIAESISLDGAWLSWAEAVVSELRANPAHSPQADRAASAARNILPRQQESLLAATFALAGERWTDAVDFARSALEAGRSDPIEAFIAICIRALALESLQDPSAPSALLEAAQAAYSSEVEEFARSTSLFGVSVSPAHFLEAYARQANGESATAALKELRDANPTRLDIRGALADSYLASGSTNEAVRELRYVAQEHETSGNLPGMIDAMRKISQAIPTNAEVKAKLIEGYLRRGILNEAVDELDLIGGLYLDRGQREEAVGAFTKAADISSALGELARGNALFHRAVEADPDNVPVRHAAVAFYLQTGSLEQATVQLREVVRIALGADDRDEAVAALHQIIALAPQDVDAYHTLGEVLTSLGEYTQAERVYRRLATFTPHDPVLEAKQSALAVLAATK